MEEKKYPERSCVCCREKNNKFELFRLAQIEDGKYKFDKTGKIQSRGIYCCKNLNCLEKLKKNKKINIDTDSLMEMLKIINKENKNLINTLLTMKNSGELVFGLNMIFEEIKKIHFLIIATDINKKNQIKLLKKANENKIPYIYLSNKKELGTIFLKDEINVIGLKNKKMAKGLIK